MSIYSALQQAQWKARGHQPQTGIQGAVAEKAAPITNEMDAYLFANVGKVDLASDSQILPSIEFYTGGPAPKGGYENLTEQERMRIGEEMKRHRTMIRNARQSIWAMGPDFQADWEEYKADHDSSTFSNLTKGIFDTIEVGIAPPAAYLYELWQGNGSDAAYSASVAKLIDAVPGMVSDESGPVDGYTDLILRIMEDVDEASRNISRATGQTIDLNGPYAGTFGESLTGTVMSFGVGLLADIFLDPITYTPGVPAGTTAKVAKTAKKFLRHTGFTKYVHTHQASQRALDMVASRVDWIAKNIIPSYALKKQQFQMDVSGEGLRHDIAGIPELEGFGVEGLHEFRNRQMAAEGMLYSKRTTAYETARSLFAQMDNEAEFALLGYVAEKGDDALMRVAQAAEHAGVVEPGAVNRIQEILPGLRQAYRDQLKEATELRLVADDQIIDNYIARMPAQTSNTRRTVDRLRERITGMRASTRRQLTESPNQFLEALGIDQSAKSANWTTSRKVAEDTGEAHTLEDLIRSGYGPELNARNQFLVRSLHQAQAMTTAHFWDSVLSDTRIARVVSEMPGTMVQQNLKEKGFGFISFSRLGENGKRVKLDFLVHDSIAQTFKEQKELMQNPSRLGGFWGVLHAFNTPFKAYSLLTPGYQMRNNYSEMNTSVVRGLGRPLNESHWTQNLPASFVRAVRKVAGTDDVQFPGLAALYQMSIRLNTAQDYSVMGSKFTDNMIQHLNLPSIQDANPLEAYLKKHPLLDENGAEVAIDDIWEEMASVGGVNRGLMGQQQMLQMDDTFWRLMRNTRKEAPTFGIDKQPFYRDTPTYRSNRDKTINYKDPETEKMVASIVVTNGELKAVRFADDVAAENVEKIFTDALLQGVRAVRLDVLQGSGKAAAITEDVLRKWGFRRFGEESFQEAAERAAREGTEGLSPRRATPRQDPMPPMRQPVPDPASVQRQEDIARQRITRVSAQEAQKGSQRLMRDAERAKQYRDFDEARGRGGTIAAVPGQPAGRVPSGGSLEGRQIEQAERASTRSRERMGRPIEGAAKMRAGHEAAQAQAGEIIPPRARPEREALPAHEPRMSDMFVMDTELTPEIRDLLETVRGADWRQTFAGIISGQNPVTQANFALGSFFENVHRTAHYLDMRLRGMNKYDAMADVKLWRFDYGDLTDAERKYMSGVHPFYTWMRKNIPLQVRTLLKSPGRYARYPKGINAVEALSADWDDTDKPDYMDEINAIRLPLAIGESVLYLPLDLQYQDLNRLNAQDIVSSMSVPLKIIGDMTFAPPSGWDVFSGTPYERYRGETGSLGISPRGERMLRSAVPLFDRYMMRPLEKTAEGGVVGLGTWAASTFAGLGVRAVDQTAATRGKLAKESALLSDFLKGKKEELMPRSTKLNIPRALADIVGKKAEQVERRIQKKKKKTKGSE